ncbi:MAG TPA: DNA gyrase inhibitor YacG [Stellaceae bacterium]|nr:DNA gyrase inhibitor YacG [Stellaceae bacterium]
MTTRADTDASRTAACPICGKPASAKDRPFCSPRCRHIDLGRWLKGNYRIESDEPPEEGSDETG